METGPHPPKPTIIGLVGGSASGKTTFIKALSARFAPEQLAVISQDHYYHPIEMQARDPRGEVNFDLPDALDRDRCLQDLHTLIEGRSVRIKEYTFNRPGAEPAYHTIQPAPVLVIEGLFVFHYREIADLLDLRVFIDAPQELMLARRIERDLAERGYPEEVVRYQWDHHVAPAYKAYLEPYRDSSDLIITNTQGFGPALEVFASYIQSLSSWKTVSVSSD
ncbi:MAG: uridine kinase [Bacteroidota bacterium]|jgi:uridine kinase